ncbi:AraC family transcriptional regulator ligand-binding domain-containing protein [Nocardioides sp. WV_118_6]
MTEWFDQPVVPVGYGLLIEEVAASFGVGPELRAAAGLPATAFADPQGRLTPLQAGHLLRLGMDLTGEPGLGYEIGLRSTVTSHGVMGFGLLTSATLREAIELGVEYSAVRLPMLTLGLVLDGDQAAVDVRETRPVGDVRQCLFELFLTGLARMTPVLTGHGQHDVELWFDGLEPEHFARYRARLPPVRFGTGVNQVRFPVGRLEEPIDTANALAARVAQAELAEERCRIGLTDDVVARVQALLGSRAAGFGLDAVAAAMHMSTRTLKRRLHAAGTTFHDLSTDARRTEALHLLRGSALAVDEIARLLGYADASSFVRAFKRWTGRTPGGYRRAIGSAERYR